MNTGNRPIDGVSRGVRKYLPYLHRPALWPEIARRLRQRIQRDSNEGERRDQQRMAAQHWCQAFGVSREAAFDALGLDERSSLVQSHAGIMTRAREAAEACPVPMGGASDIDLLYQLCEQLQATKVIETGVAFGWSALALLMSLVKRECAHLVSVDLPYMEFRNDRWVGCVVPPDLQARWSLHRMADREGLPRALREHPVIDLAHYDSDKSVKGRGWAYPLLWDALRPGGMLVSDDVGDNLAFRDFSESVVVSPLVFRLHKKYLGVLVKPAI